MEQMILLQVIEGLSKGKEGLYISIISVLITGIVWLALYLRKLHNKMIHYMQNDSAKMTEALTRSAMSAEQQARSNERLSDTLTDLKETILTSNPRRKE
jgi:hypothetical protein